MSKYFLVYVFICVSVISFGQGHFVVAYSGNPYFPMNINIVTAQIGGVNLVAGDEIAAFDGSICCGKVTLSQEININDPATFVILLASQNDGLGQFPDGYTEGHPISYKFWDQSINLEISGITAEYLDPETKATIPAPTYSNGSAIVMLSVATPVYFKMQLKVFLEGSFDTETNTIKTDLNKNSQLPLSQPYQSSPWLYTGDEAVVAIPAGVVDWILIELRQATSPDLATSSTILAKRAAFLKNDGTIVDLDGSSPVQFVNYTVISGNNVYPVIRHRNHLAIMSSTGAILNNGIYSYDFTTGLAQAFGGGNGYKQVSTDKYAMVVGDIDQDGNIFVSDYNLWAVGFGQTNGYFNADLDMDGNVFVSDYNKWAVNFGSTIYAGLKSAHTKSKYISCVPK